MCRLTEIERHDVRRQLSDEFGPWQPGTESPETGELSFGGWIWRYDLETTGPSRTTVALSYDWSAVPPHIREYIQFPPFPKDHLDNSLQHLSDLAAKVWLP